ncbi:MAG: multiple sugar transport system substrate-binding protein [Sphingomonadales bacterium]|jgi:multiple sugar transport system substrate-binding protein|nr:multiple sugar transport system substrate-binding protein [Sphingomonadales bacterium]
MALVLAAAAMLGSCHAGDRRTAISVQRFFGECDAAYGRNTDPATAEGECGIMTTLLNRFQAENPDIRLDLNIVAWPGYAQLTAQIAAGDPPDLVTMHQSMISDYQGRGLLEPVDALLDEAGLPPGTFTAAGRRGVTKAGHFYAMPWDTIGGLFHVNTKLMAQAGLMKSGRPVFPTNPDELLALARQFKARTGKPYFVQSEVNDPASDVHNLYSYLLAQDAIIFPDARHVRLRTPEAKRIVELFRRIEVEGLSTHHQDYPAALASFMHGEGGIFPVGTWVLGSFEQEAKTPGRPLYNAYAVYPFPHLWGRDASFVDGHSWVMPKRKRTPEQKAAVAHFFKFMAAHNFDWSRTGHIPAVEAVVESPKFQSLPHRKDIAPLALTGEQLPDYVQRQSAIQGLIGEELASAIAGTKSVDQALADAERRVDELLGQVL